MISLINIAWLAGLLEGEGCFAMYRCDRPQIKLCMTDLDTVSKAAGLMGTYSVLERRIVNIKHKQQYVIYVYNTAAISWMMTIYPFMGKRRREKIEEVIAKWKLYTPNPMGPPRKIKQEQYKEIAQRKQSGESALELAKFYNVSRQTIDRICTWVGK